MDRGRQSQREVAEEEGEIMMERRVVRVTYEASGKSWLVRFVHRRPRQRHSAATFYALHHSEEDVKAWVRGNPKLVLEEDAK